MHNNELTKFLYENDDVANFIREHKLTNEEVMANLTAFVCYINGKAEGTKCSIRMNNGEVEFYYLTNADIHHGDVIFNNITTKENFFNLASFDFNLNKDRIETKEKLNTFVNEKDKWNNFFITGLPQSGKTKLLITIANILYKSDKTKIALVNWPDFISEYRDFDNRDTTLLKSFKEVELLLIDDLGLENGSDFSIQTLNQIISYRTTNNLKTIFATQFTIDAYAKYLSSGNKHIVYQNTDSLLKKLVSKTIFTNISI